MDCLLCVSAKTELLPEVSDPGSGVKKYWRCAECRLIFMDSENRLNMAAEKERYDTHQNNPADSEYRKFLNRLALPLIRVLPKGAKGLDFGSGPGPTMNVILQEQGFDCLNYDPIYSPDQNLLNDQYDFLTCTETAEHFFDPRKEFQLLDRLLKPGGVLGVMTVLIKEGENFETWWYRKDPTHVSFYSLKTCEWIAGWRGWKWKQPAENVVLFVK